MIIAYEYRVYLWRHVEWFLSCQKEGKKHYVRFAELSETAADLCANDCVSWSDIHQFLLEEPNYLCKECHSTIRKYKELKPHLKKLQDKMLASLLPDPGQVL